MISILYKYLLKVPLAITSISLELLGLLLEYIICLVKKLIKK